MKTPIKVTKSASKPKRKKKLKSHPRKHAESLYDSISSDPVLNQKLVDISERIRTKMFSIPGLLDDVMEGLSAVQGMTGGGVDIEDMKELMNSPVTLAGCTSVLRQITEGIMELGREEMRKKYALQELAAAFDDPLDPDFEEVV